MKFSLDKKLKLNVHETSWTSSEHLMYVQFTSYAQDVARKYFIGIEVLSCDAYLPNLGQYKVFYLSELNE